MEFIKQLHATAKLLTRLPERMQPKELMETLKLTGLDRLTIKLADLAQRINKENIADHYGIYLIMSQLKLDMFSHSLKEDIQPGGDGIVLNYLYRLDVAYRAMKLLDALIRNSHQTYTFPSLIDYIGEELFIYKDEEHIRESLKRFRKDRAIEDSAIKGFVARNRILKTICGMIIRKIIRAFSLNTWNTDLPLDGIIKAMNDVSGPEGITKEDETLLKSLKFNDNEFHVFIKELVNHLLLIKHIPPSPEEKPEDSSADKKDDVKKSDSSASSSTGTSGGSSGGTSGGSGSGNQGSSLSTKKEPDQNAATAPSASDLMLLLLGAGFLAA